MRCANPKCQAESNYLRDGSLYWIDELLAGSTVPHRRFIWLCSQCSPGFVVETWRPPGQQLLRKPPALVPRLLAKPSLPGAQPQLSDFQHRLRA